MASLCRGRLPIPGAQDFIARLLQTKSHFLVITNNPLYTPRDLSHRLASEGLLIPEQNLFTSALATAQFLASQRPNGTAFAIGEAGLTSALHQVGYTLTATRPEYVVLGETHSYNLEQITQAIRLVLAGPASLRPTRTRPAHPNSALCQRAERWRRSSSGPRACGRTSSASRIR